MASTFWPLNNKRKRKASSTTSSSSCGTNSIAGYEDDEISFNFYASPEKKRHKLDVNSDVIGSRKISSAIVDEDISFKVVNQPTASTMSQAVDEDITFRVNNVPTASTSSSTSSSPRKVCQLVDEDISFKISDLSEKEEAVVEPRISPNGYILPDPLPEGLIVTDLRGGSWKLGKTVGLGGFGEIYSAASWNDQHKNETEDFVVKVEPHSNGPLFVEINFYLRAAQPSDIEAYTQPRGLSHLGVPPFVASGSLLFRGKKLRFLVVPRFGIDLQSILDASKNVLATKTATAIAEQVIDAYEYLHERGYAHKDLKGSNLLFSRQGPTGGKVFLIDYGLVSKLTRAGIPKPNIPDPRSAHEGTLEFCSRDAHLGCVSRRGDLEVLLFNLVDWLGGKLPWEQTPALKPGIIHDKKIFAFQDIPYFLKQAFDERPCPAFLATFMTAVQGLQFHDTPDYDFFRSILQDSTNDLNNSVMSTSSDEEVTFQVKMVNPDRKLKKLTSPKGHKRNARAKVPIADIRKRIRRPPPISEPEVNENEIYERALEEREREHEIECLRNPTPAMLEQLEKIATRKRKKLDDSKPSSSIAGSQLKDSSKKRKRKSPNNPTSKSPKTIRRHRKNVRLDETSTSTAGEEGSSRSPSKRLNMTQRNASSSIRQRFQDAVSNFGVSQFFTQVSRTLFPFQK